MLLLYIKELIWNVFYLVICYFEKFSKIEPESAVCSLPFDEISPKVERNRGYFLNSADLSR